MKGNTASDPRTMHLCTVNIIQSSVDIIVLVWQNPVAVAYASISSLSFWSSQNREYFSGLKKELPLNIHLLSLRAVSPKKQ